MKLPLEGRWVVLAGGIAVLFAAALVMAVRFVSLPKLNPKAKPAALRAGGIGIVSPGGASSGVSPEDRALMDPNPLFLPTEFNASQLRLPPGVRREPGTSLQSVSSKYEYDESGVGVLFPAVVAVPGDAVDALSFGRSHNPYEVLSRFNRAGIELPRRLAVVEVIQAATGRIVFSAPLIISNPPTQFLTADWMPLEWIAVIDVVGLIGQPVLTRGSGVEAVDAFFKTYLARQFHLGERLPPGFYALRIGP